MTVLKELNNHKEGRASALPFFKMWLHNPNNLSETPCVGRCTTSVIPFDDVCKGCGRTVAEIRDWGSYTELEKKLINIRNSRKYEIRQVKQFKIMTDKEKSEDIRGRLITTRCLIEMIGEDLLKTFGKNNLTKEVYEKLYEAHESVLEATEKLPIEHDQAV